MDTLKASLGEWKDSYVFENGSSSAGGSSAAGIGLVSAAVIEATVVPGAVVVVEAKCGDGYVLLTALSVAYNGAPARVI